MPTDIMTLKSGLEVPFESLGVVSYSPSIVIMALSCINVKNFHGSLTTVVRARNDTSKTAIISNTIFDRTYWYSLYKRWRFENWWDQTFCILLIKDVLSLIESANLWQRQNLKRKWSQFEFGLIWIRISDIYIPKLWMHYLVTVVGISHFAKYGTNRLLIVVLWEFRKQEMLTNVWKLPIAQWWRKWKSYPESTRRSGSPPKVNHF